MGPEEPDYQRMLERGDFSDNYTSSSAHGLSLDGHDGPEHRQAETLRTRRTQYYNNQFNSNNREAARRRSSDEDVYEGEYTPEHSSSSNSSTEIPQRRRVVGDSDIVLEK